MRMDNSSVSDTTRCPADQVVGSENEQSGAVGSDPLPGEHQCAGCGLRRKKLLACARCLTARYCSKECQMAHYRTHKPSCLAAAASGKPAKDTGNARASNATNPRPRLLTSGPSSDRVSWADLQRLQGMPAIGKVLEVKVATPPMPFLRYAFEGEDQKGDVRTVGFYLNGSSSLLQTSLRQGKIVRWRDPRFHNFFGGQTGARIEDGDMRNVEISDA